MLILQEQILEQFVARKPARKTQVEMAWSDIVRRGIENDYHIFAVLELSLS